jgi:hypothetical protein
MNKEQYLNLKKILSDLVTTIKSSNSIKDEAHSAYMKFLTDNPTNIGVTYKPWTTQQNLDFKKIQDAMYKAYDEASSSPKKYRLQHIVYCIARSRTYKEIEGRVRKSNRIKFDDIAKYFDQWEVEVPDSFLSDIEEVLID